MAKIAEVQEVAIEKLVPYENNAKIHGSGQIEKIKASIKEFGFLTPCLIDKDFNIIAGHGRVMASKELGMDKIPCVFIEGLSDVQRKAYILADNKLGELGEWDMDIVLSELEDLRDMDFDVSLTGFELPEIEEQETDIEEDEVPEEVETRCKMGDLWELGDHRLICGDSTDVNVIDRLMDGTKADTVFTDPPYRMQAQGGSNQWVGRQASKLGESIKDLCDFEPTGFLSILPQIFDGDMNAYIFCNKDLVPDYLNWGINNRYAFNILFWKKPNALPLGGQHRPDVEYLLYFRKNAIWNNGLKDVSYSKCLEFGRDNTTDHPTMKPIGLITNELKISSNKSSVVVDFFGGSGSTLIACEQLNRRCYMCELAPHYCDVILQRWENFTGEKAKLIVEKP